MKRLPSQCQAVTSPTTYSRAHRCLKRSGVQKVGAMSLCAHHRASFARARA